MEFDQAPPALPVEIWKDIFQHSVHPFPDFQESIQTFVRNRLERLKDSERLENSEERPTHGLDPLLPNDETIREVVLKVLREPMLDRLKLVHVCKFWTEVAKQHCSALWTQIFLVPGRVYLASLFWELSSTSPRLLELYLIAHFQHDFTKAEVDEIAMLVSGCGSRVIKCFVDVDLQLGHAVEHHCSLANWKSLSTTLLMKLPALTELRLTTFYRIPLLELLIILDRIGENLTTLYLEAKTESQERGEGDPPYVGAKLPRLEKTRIVYYPLAFVESFVTELSLRSKTGVCHKDVPVGEWVKIR